MKKLLAGTLGIAAWLALNGCAMSAADREFYGGHWMHPTELDQAAPPPATNGMPDDPVDSQ